MKSSNYIYSIFFLMSLGFFMNSCVKEMDEIVVDLDSKLVLNAIVSTDQHWQIKLTKSGNVLSKTDTIANVDEADVFVQDIESNEMVRLYSMGNGLYENENIIPQSGHRYEVTASHADYKRIKAQTEVPQEVDILKTDSTSIVIDGKETWNIDFEILNSQSSQSFYICELYKFERDVENINITDNQGGYAASNDVAYFDISDQENEVDRELNSGVRYFVEGDDVVNAQLTVVSSKTADGDIDNENSGSDEIEYYYELKIKSVSHSFYEYLKSVETYKEENNGNIVPTNSHKFYSNIENGFGILGSYNSQIFEF